MWYCVLQKQAALHHQYSVADGRRKHLAQKCNEGQEAMVFGKQAGNILIYINDHEKWWNLNIWPEYNI